MNWLWSQVFQGSVKNVFAVSVPSLTLAGTVAVGQVSNKAIYFQENSPEFQLNCNP